MNRRLFLSTLFPKRKRLANMRYARGGLVKNKFLLKEEDPGASMPISVIESRGATGYPPKKEDSDE